MGRVVLPKLFRPLNTIRLELKILWYFRHSLWLLKKTIRLGEHILGSEKITWDESSPFTQLTILFSASGIHRLRSIYILCKKGFARDTVPLLRVSFEALVDFKAMYQDKSRIQDYTDYNIYQRMKLISQETALSYPIENRELINNQNKKLEEQWDLVKLRFSYKDKNGKTRIFNRWSGQGGLPELAEKVGLGLVYRQIWSFYSNYSHGGSITLNNHILGIENGEVGVEIGSSPEFVKEAILTSVATYLELFSLINQEFDLGFGDHIKEIEGELKSSLKK